MRNMDDVRYTPSTFLMAAGVVVIFTVITIALVFAGIIPAE